MQQTRSDRSEYFLAGWNGTIIPSVEDMRMLIPFLLQKVFPNSSWKQKPSGWPDEVHFVDPNNGSASEGEKKNKPKKDVCENMFLYLVSLWKGDNRNVPEQIKTVETLLGDLQLHHPDEQYSNELEALLHKHLKKLTSQPTSLKFEDVFTSRDSTSHGINHIVPPSTSKLPEKPSKPQGSEESAVQPSKIVGGQQIPTNLESSEECTPGRAEINGGEGIPANASKGIPDTPQNSEENDTELSLGSHEQDKPSSQLTSSYDENDELSDCPDGGGERWLEKNFRKENNQEM